MLKYLILSTPRCGSSTLMRCCELYLGSGTFVREPLNPYEDARLHPAILHGRSVAERSAILCDPACEIVGIKHVYSPFNREMTGPVHDQALRSVLSLKGLRVILLSRRNVRHQFISMEIALQSGDWWSGGPGALPSSLDTVKAGRSRPLDDTAVRVYLAGLEEASLFLRRACRDANADFVECSYEDLFAGPSSTVPRRVASALAHFGFMDRAAALRLDALLREGRRFSEIGVIQKRLGALYPALRES